MVNFNPGGVFAFGNNAGQHTAITGNNIPVDTALNPLQFAGVQGATGLQGITGLVGIQGITGVAVQGLTGIQGIQGITGIMGQTGLIGTTGSQGITGSIFNVTGLQGITGLQGTTGVAGVTGIRGMTGIPGLQGATGIQGVTGFSPTGISFFGATGIQGTTGILGATGTQGITGSSFLGTTGIQGVTGIIGATGLQGTLTLEGLVQSTTTASYIVAANTITATGQQIEFLASGITAINGAATTLTISFGGTTIFTDLKTDSTAKLFTVEGLIIKQSGNNQEIGIKVLYNLDIGNANRTATTLNMASNQTLTITLTSAGSGHTIYTLVVRRISAPS